MSERSHTVPVPEGEYFESSRFAGLSLLLGSVALVALVLCAVGAVVNPHQFSYSWLFAFAVFFTLCAGCFFWTIVHHATDAEWSVVVRRQLENIASLMAVLVRAFITFFFFIVASLLLRRFSIAQDKDGNPRFTVRMRKVSFISLPLFALSLTFGACDWLMS